MKIIVSSLFALAIGVTPPGTATNIIVASNVAPLGKAADADDLQVIKTQKAVVEVARSSDALAVELPLLDASRRVIGALGIHLAYRADVRVPFNTRAPYLSVRKRVFVLRAVTGHFNFNRT